MRNVLSINELQFFFTSEFYVKEFSRSVKHFLEHFKKEYLTRLFNTIIQNDLDVYLM